MRTPALEPLLSFLVALATLWPISGAASPPGLAPDGGQQLAAERPQLIYRHRVVTVRPAGSPKRQVKIGAAGRKWVCIGQVCTTTGPWRGLSLATCSALAQQLGAIRSFTMRRWDPQRGAAGRSIALKAADLRRCNAVARAAASSGKPSPGGKGAAGSTAGPSDGGRYKQAAQVDLAIRSFNILELGARRRVTELAVGQRITVFLRVRASAPPPRPRVGYELYIGNRRERAGYIPFMARHPLLAQGDLIDPALAFAFGEPGQYEIRVVIDPRNEFPELDERNNERRLIVNVRPVGQGLDLGLISGYLFDSAAADQVPLQTVDVGQRVLIGISVINNSPQAIQNVEVRATLGDRELSRLNVGPLGPGQQQWIELLREHRGVVGNQPVSGYAFEAVGPHSLVVTLDPNNRFREINEGNNRKQIDFQVVPPRGQPAVIGVRPDIEIVKVAVLSNDPRFCDNHTLVGVENRIVVTYRYHRPHLSPAIDRVAAQARVTGRPLRLIGPIGHPGAEPGQVVEHSFVFARHTFNTLGILGAWAQVNAIRAYESDGANNARQSGPVHVWTEERWAASGRPPATPECRTQVR